MEPTASDEIVSFALPPLKRSLFNLHGALILTATALRIGMKIWIHVLDTEKRAVADVVYVDPDHPRHYGINLEKPENIWGLTLTPNDWQEG